MAARSSSSLCDVSSGDGARGQGKMAHSVLIVRSRFLRLNATSSHYRFKTFKSRGAMLVLLWSFCALYLLLYLVDGPNYKLPFKVMKEIEPVVVLLTCFLLYPVIGWLADVKLGRYEVIRWSLRGLWILSALFCLSSALLEYYHDVQPRKLKSALNVIFYVPISFCLGGVLANIIQFGVDQLADASSVEINSFLRWFSWVFFVCRSCMGLSLWCICPRYKALSYLLFPVIFTAAIVLDHLCNHWLVKEPTGPNTLSLIFRVLQYAVRNKYPRLRSAFTYGEGKPYTRIDLAKNRYGGPFTTDQVEDVKTFFRIISVMTAATLFASMFLLVIPSYSILTSRLHGGQYHTITKQCEDRDILACLQRTAAVNSGSFLMVIILPISLLNPLLKRTIGRVPILWKLNAGLVLLFLSICSCTVLEFVAVHEYSLHHNTTIECAFTATGKQNSMLPLDYKWMMISNLFIALAQYLLLTSFGEFLCAQSPYSMKGLLFGFTYGAVGFFVIIGYAVSRPFLDNVIVKFMSFSYGCMAWYLVLNLAILLVTLLIFCGAYKCYKSRFRNYENAPVDYYSNSFE